MTKKNQFINLPLDSDLQPPQISIRIESNLASGAFVRLKSDSLGSLQNWHAQSLAFDDGTPCEEVDRYSLEAHKNDWAGIGQRASMLTVRLPRAVQKGEMLILKSRFKHRTTSLEEACRPARKSPIRRPFFMGMQWGAVLEVVEDVDQKKGTTVSDPFGFKFSSGKAVQLIAAWKADGTLNLRYYDAYDNPVVHKALVTVEAQGDSATETVALSERFSENRLETGDNFPIGHRFSITGENGLQTFSNPRPRTEDGTGIYFGDFHWHCELSCDGHRPLADALITARDEICLDFAGPADHIWSGGVFGENATPEMQVEILREFNDPGHFACLPGAEYSCPVGHANFYCDNFEHYLEVCHKLPSASAQSKAVLGGEYDWTTLTGAALEGHTLLIPHHANTNSYVEEGVLRPDTGRPFWNAMTFPQGREMPWIRGFEMYQVRGSFEDEIPDPSWRIYHGGYGASARTALAKGYRFGFTGGTDNHSGFPSRSAYSGRIDGLTAVLADELSPEGLWRALQARRCYATTGTRIVCDVTLNGYPIGSELQLAWNEGRRMHIRIHGTAPLDSVQIISAGVILDEIPVQPDSPDLITEWEDTRPGRPLDDVYYYLRVRQVDDNLAWLSPFWIDLKR